MSTGVRLYWFLLQLAAAASGIAGGIWLYDRITS